MLTEYRALRNLPAAAGYGPGDCFVLIGELFGRGYANGIVEEARRKGMTIIGTTVGRRESDGTLRPLNAQELEDAERLLGGRIINIPLEAGFDMESVDSAPSICERLKTVKPDDILSFTLDTEFVTKARLQGVARFNRNMTAVAQELEQLIPAGANVLFTHSMAGGIPRARVFMPILNRVFKGQGEKFLASETFWNTDLGKLCEQSFAEVTADTFSHLIEATAALRARIEGAGRRASYTAYGYHGCEVLIKGRYTWQSYTPYLQGWAKIRLEQVAEKAWATGIHACVFNAPEIQTNSSALFLGVEISLYPLLTALEREGGGEKASTIKKACQALLKEGESVETLLARAEEYLSAPQLGAFADIATWPHHNTADHAAFMLGASAELLAMNADPKQIVCAELSQAVFHAVGVLMFHSAWELPAPVLWLNHDIVAKCLLAG